MSEFIKTEGRFDRERRNIFFLATDTNHYFHCHHLHPYWLFPINELPTDRHLDMLDETLKPESSIFLDSGVFDMAMTYARQNAVSMDVALNTPPENIPGFEGHFARYVEIMLRFGSRVWGYVEIDQGGRENKIKTRTRLEGLGLRPIPVYHPLNDGWDYFDYLAGRYDRICFGNIVQASYALRKRLLATLWERRQKHPHLWVHILGLTVNNLMNAYPSDSCDSSTWLGNTRWGNLHEYAGQIRAGDLPGNFRYQLASDPESEVGSWKANQMMAYQMGGLNRNWNTFLKENGHD